MEHIQACHSIIRNHLKGGERRVLSLLRVQSHGDGPVGAVQGTTVDLTAVQPQQIHFNMKEMQISEREYHRVCVRVYMRVT